MDTFTFAGIIGSEDELTGDGRMIKPGALRFSTPAPLQFVREASGGHDGSVTVGTFTLMERRGNDIYAEGEFLAPDPLVTPTLAEDVATAVLLVAQGAAPGVSMDLSEVSVEFHIAEKFFAQTQEPGEDDEDDKLDGMVKVFEMDPSDEVALFTDALVRAATLVSIPAFKNANLQVLKDGAPVDFAQVVDHFAEATPDLEVPFDDAGNLGMEFITDLFDENPCACSITAAAPPRQVDDRYFEQVALAGPTALQVDENKKVFGHIATWDTCHTGFPGVCRTAPNDPTGEYNAFHQSRIQTNAGTMRVGVLTVGGGHADPKFGPRAAIEHYDNVGTAWAYVRAYEDDHGIAVVGVLADGLDDATLATALAHPVSGDWRNLGAGLELVAACSVNTPGFPVLAASAGVQTALVASSAPDPNAPQSHDGVQVIVPNPAVLTSAVADELERRAEARDLEDERLAIEAEIAPVLDEEAEALAAEVMA